MDKTIGKNVESCNPSLQATDYTSNRFEEYRYARAAGAPIPRDMQQTAYKNHEHLPALEIVGQQNRQFSDKSPSPNSDSQMARNVQYGLVADTTAKSSEKLPNPKYDSRNELSEAWGYGKDGKIVHFVKVGSKDGKPIWVVDSDNRTKEQVEKAYRLNQAQIERGIPAVAAKEKGMLNTVGVQIDVSISGDGQSVTVKSKLNGRTSVSEFATVREQKRAESGVTCDESGKPRMIECKNANGSNECFKRVGYTEDGRELWSINGSTTMPAKVEQDKNGKFTISYESGNLHVTHEINNGVRTTKTSRR